MKTLIALIAVFVVTLATQSGFAGNLDRHVEIKATMKKEVRRGRDAAFSCDIKVHDDWREVANAVYTQVMLFEKYGESVDLDAGKALGEFSFVLGFVRCLEDTINQQAVDRPKTKTFFLGLYYNAWFFLRIRLDALSGDISVSDSVSDIINRADKRMEENKKFMEQVDPEGEKERKKEEKRRELKEIKEIKLADKYAKSYFNKFRTIQKEMKIDDEKFCKLLQKEKDKDCEQLKESIETWHDDIRLEETIQKVKKKVEIVPTVAPVTMVDVLIKGVDNGIKTNKQQDYKEAVMNAKQQAIERTGVDIKSITKVEGGKLKYDMIESMAKAVLLPGFQVMDIGYQTDGTYQVVLSGKIRMEGKEEVKESQDRKALKYAISLMESGKIRKAGSVISSLINSKEDYVKSNAMYYSILWIVTLNDRCCGPKVFSLIGDMFEKLKVYYPNFKYLSFLESVIKAKEGESIIAQTGPYIAYANGIVKDTTTGLEWVAGPDKIMDLDDTKVWVQSLNIDGGGWRKPKISELKTLYRPGRGTRNMTPLLKTTGWWVWSTYKDKDKEFRNTQWYFGFDAGRKLMGFTRHPSLRAFAVRYGNGE